MATFGLTTIGANLLSGITGDTTVGSRYTAGASGTLSKIWAYISITGVGTAPMRAAIFANTGSNTVGALIASASTSVNISNTSPQWISVDVSASITAGTEYWLFVWADTSGFSGAYNLYYDTNAISNASSTCFGISPFADWTQVGDGINDNYSTGSASIYGEFTTSDQVVAWLTA